MKDEEPLDCSEDEEPLDCSEWAPHLPSAIFEVWKVNPQVSVRALANILGASFSYVAREIRENVAQKAKEAAEEVEWAAKDEAELKARYFEKWKAEEKENAS